MGLPLLESSSPLIRGPSSPPLASINSHLLHLPFSHLLRFSVPARRYPRMSSSMHAAQGVRAVTAAQDLRRILESPGCHQGPCVHDAMSAKLVERAGFPFCFMAGFPVSAARLGLPDAGLISYGEMLDQGHQILEAVSFPVIGDADTGYGNSINVKRTVKGFIKAGFAGILLEDQVSPKACGHTRGRKVVSREEAIMRIKAAVDAREESGSDIVILARTDSRQAISVEEALWRVKAFADTGADVLFIDALASREEMEAFCQILPSIPKMANMLEGGGKSPIFSPSELQKIGYKIVGYPLSLIGVSIRAMEDALIALKSGRLPPPASLPSFEEIKEKVGFNAYYKEEDRYKIFDGPTSSEEAGQKAENVTYPVVEVISPLHDNYKSSDSNERTSGIWSRTLRLKVTGSNGNEKFNVRIPAGFLEGMANIVPGLGGVNVIELLENASLETASEKGKLLLDFNGALGDRVQVFVE